MTPNRVPLLASALSAVLIGCGGGGGSNIGTSSSPSPVLSGVVAVGAPLPSVTVQVIDANGVEATAETAADGSYQVIEPTGVQMVAPFKLRVRTLLGTTEVSLDSFALSRGATANVTPLSSAVMSLLNASAGYNSADLNVAGVTSTQVAAANAQLAAALQPVLSAANVTAASFNPVSSAFVANNQGIDSVMDRVAIEPSASGVAISNRFVLLAEGGAAPAPVIVTPSGASASLPPGIEPPSASTLTRFTNKLKACFSLAHSARVSYTVNSAGRNIYSSNTLHPDCAVLADSAYLSQGQSFGQKWLHFLANADFDSTTQFVLVPQYVVDRSSAGWPGDGIAYVYNINLIDRNRLTYTLPEVMAKVGGDFIIRGNQRRFDVSVQPMFSKLNDNAGTAHSVEGRLRIGLDPTLIPVGTDGTYVRSGGTGAYQVESNKPLPKILCAWVTGPLLQKDEMHDPAAPKGGLLMVPPHSDLTARRDYSAVRIKYPMTFDPVNNPADKAQLFADCKTTHNTGTSVSPRNEVASAETNNAFTIDAAKTTPQSTSVMAAYTSLRASQAFPTSLNRAFCPVLVSGVWKNGTSGAITTTDNVSGWCNATRRENFVTSAQRQAFEDRYRDPKDLQYTFYVFVDAAYTASAPETAYSGFTNADAFFASAEKLNVRTVGRLPFLDKTTSDGVEIYAGTEKFRGVGQSMINAYLAPGAPTLSSATSIAASWTIPTGAEGIDRLGIGGWFRRSDGSRIGAATFSDSFGLPRSVTQSTFPLTEAWYGYDRADYQSGTFTRSPHSATTTYREIWVRSYDRNNRQIQTVEFAVR